MELPSFAELPVRVGAPAHASWGVWDDGDQLGCWNTIDAAAVRRGAACVRRGRTFRLDAPHDPELTRYMGRRPFEHRTERVGGIAWDDVLADFNTQGSTQWDGFGHFASWGHGHYGGLDRDGHGVDRWAERSFATRAVLADVARWREEQGRPLDAGGGEMVPIDEVLATLEAQGSDVEPGDVLLLRFGWMRWWRENRPPAGGLGRGLVQPGVEPSLRAAEVLWDLHIAAVGCDPALDPIPGRWATLGRAPTGEELADPTFALGLTLHAVLPYLGLSIGEFFDLDALAEDCAADGDWTCLLTSAPIQLPDGVATPANAVAIR